MVATMLKKYHGLSLDSKCVDALLREMKTYKYTVTPYFKSRLTERGLTVDDIKDALTHGKLIEFHKLKGTRRILVRDSSGTCLVIDLDTKKVITTYFNRSGDNHSTLKRDEYVGGGKAGLNLKCESCSSCNSH